MTTTTTAWAHRVQDGTLLEADHHRTPWTKTDIEYVVAHTDVERDEDLALALGRSLYAVWAMQHRIRHEGAAGVLATFAPRPVAACGSCFMELTPSGACPTCD